MTEYSSSSKPSDNKCDRESKTTADLAGKVMLAWRDLSLYQASSDKTRPPSILLHKLNGHLRFCSLNLVIGVSGRELLRLLKHCSGGGLESDFQISAESKVFRSKHIPVEEWSNSVLISVDSQNNLFPHLTALQCLVYASRLKNLHYEQQANKTIKLDHEARARELLKELQIESITSTKVENLFSGERVLLALAHELTPIRMPSLICCEEILSELDIKSALFVVKSLAALVARHPIAVVVSASTEQPTLEMANHFHQLYVLGRAEGVVCIYSGTLEGTNEAIKDIITDSNTEYPLDTLMEMSCCDNNKEDETAIVNKLVMAQLGNELQHNSDLYEDTELVTNVVGLKAENGARFQFGSVWILLSRELRYFLACQWREYLFLACLMVGFVYCAFVYFPVKELTAETGCLDVGRRSVDLNDKISTDRLLQVQQRLVAAIQYLVFTVPVLMTLLSLYTGLGLARAFNRQGMEHRNGWYSTGALYLARVIFDWATLVPLIVVYAQVTSIQPTAEGRLQATLVMVLTFNAISQALAYAVVLGWGGTHRPVHIAITQIAVVIASLLLSNTFNRVERMPAIHQVLGRLSALRWAMDALMMATFGSDRCSQVKGEKVVQLVAEWLNLNNNNTTNDYSYGWHSSVAWLAVCVLLYHAIALCLAIRANKSERTKMR